MTHRSAARRVNLAVTLASHVCMPGRTQDRIGAFSADATRNSPEAFLWEVCCRSNAEPAQGFLQAGFWTSSCWQTTNPQLLVGFPDVFFVLAYFDREEDPP
jgi:hypothetical protein